MFSSNPFSSKTDELIDAVQHQPGTTNPETRRALVDYGRALAFGDTADSQPLTTLAPYIDKVVKHAYKIVDADVERLRRAGYSEDEIFEMTVAAALGAALARLEKGYSLVDGGDA